MHKKIFLLTIIILVYVMYVNNSMPFLQSLPSLPSLPSLSPSLSPSLYPRPQPHAQSCMSNREYTHAGVDIEFNDNYINPQTVKGNTLYVFDAKDLSLLH